MKRSLAWLLIWLSLQVPFARAAEIGLASDSIEERGAMIILDGKIEEGDFEKFKTLIDNQNGQGVVVGGIILRSPGGAVAPALEIGRYIRLKRLVTYSPLSCDEDACICASACALIWLGGVARTGIVYVHRPSLRGENQRLDFDTWDRVISTAQNDIDLYLSEMHITDRVSEILLSTIPSDISSIEAGRDIAINDRNLEDFTRARCGPPMSEFQNFYISSFEGNGDQADESELEPTARELLNALREKASWLKKCHGDVLYTAQEQAQLSR